MILDSNALSAFFSGEEALVSKLRDVRRHHLPVVVIGEYRYGLLRSSRRRLFTELLEGLLREFVLLPVEVATTEHYAIIRQQLRDSGTPIPGNDVWIAALALQHGLSVVTRDVHFDSVEGLRRLSW